MNNSWKYTFSRRELSWNYTFPRENTGTLLDVTATTRGRNDQRRNLGVLEQSHQGRQAGIGADTGAGSRRFGVP